MSDKLLFDDLYREPLAEKPKPRRIRSGEERKHAGMAAATWNREDILAHVREVAIFIAIRREDRCCHMGLVNEQLAKEGIYSIGNMAGSVFQTKHWEFTGERVKDSRPRAHANELKVWRLRK